MIRTVFVLVKVVNWMLTKNKQLKLAKKYDKEGNIEARDEIVHRCVPL